MIEFIKKISFITTSIFIISCTNTTSANNTIISNVNANEFQSLIKNAIGIILDVRTLNEYSSGHLIEATNIDYYAKDFSSKLELMSKTVPIYVYCRSGGNYKRGIKESNCYSTINKSEAIASAKTFPF